MKNLGILYKFELGKILRRKTSWITIIITLLLVLGTLGLDSLGGYFVNGVQVDTNFHMNQIFKADQMKLDGRDIDQALLEEMREGYGRIPKEAINGAVSYIGTREYQTYARPYSAIFNFVRSAGNMNTSEVMVWKADEQELYQRRQQAVEKDWEGYLLAEEEKEFWKEQEEKLKWPVTFRFKEGYWHLLDGTYTIGLLILIAVNICLAGVFADEQSRKMDQLILSSKYGKTPVYLAKILAGVSFAAGFSFLVLLLSLLEIRFLYGLEGFSADFRLIMPGYSYPLNVGESVIVTWGLVIVVAIFIGVFAMFLSELFHNSLGTLALTLGLIILCMFVSTVPEHYRVLSQIWSYLPVNAMAVWNIFDCRTVPILGKTLVYWQAAPILYLILGGVLAVIGKGRYDKCQVSGR